MKKKYDLHYVILFIDPLSGIASEYMQKNLFSTEYDLIYTFDYKDAQKMNAIHTMNLYSIPQKILAEKGNSGVYFAGTNNKNRVAVLQDIHKKLTENNIECRFRITKVPHSVQSDENIVYNELVPYEKILSELQKYDCILEVLQPGQVGVTLRYYEAIVYNKKLLTNNQFVKSLPFYNPEYICVFDTPEDIDISWVKNNVEVDYGYEGEFSPIKFIEDIRERVKL